MKLLGKIAIFTGASRGIGKAIAMCFAGEGANLALCARNEEILNSTVEEIKKRYSVKVLGIKTDVSKREDVEHFVKKTIDSFKHR